MGDEIILYVLEIELPNNCSTKRPNNYGPKDFVNHAIQIFTNHSQTTKSWLEILFCFCSYVRWFINYLKFKIVLRFATCELGT